MPHAIASSTSKAKTTVREILFLPPILQSRNYQDMDEYESYFLTHNKLLEEKLDYCLHSVEVRLDKLYNRLYDQQQTFQEPHKQTSHNTSTNQFSSYSFLQFKAPYIRDFRNFSGPANEDLRQIKELSGEENIDYLIKNKNWTKDSKRQLHDAILDHYAQSHIIELIKQKNVLSKQLQDSWHDPNDIKQKISLIEEQTEQVKARKEPRIFVPEDRDGMNVDWCAISARLASTYHEAQDCRFMWSNQLHWSINDGPWTKDEDVCLLNAIKKFGINDWDSVARELNSNRLPWQCCSRYQREFASSSLGSAPITEDDKDKIIEVINLCRIGNFVPWNQVMYFIQYHSLFQVKYQWHKLLSDRKSTQFWSQHEDLLLLKAVAKFGDKDWNRIANLIPDRSNKSCRERYIMRLKFLTRALGNWRPKEDEKLLQLIERFGTNWSVISSNFPERNNHQLRNRYELLRNQVGRIGPIKRKKLHRNAEGLLVSHVCRRQKPSLDREVDERLREIFTAYQDVKFASKTLVCRSAQDELIYQNLIQVVRHIIFARDMQHNLLSSILDKSLKKSAGTKYNLLSPNLLTIQGYRAWTMQQDYLNQFCNEDVDLERILSTNEYHEMLKVIMSLFLWPAILSRVERPLLDLNKFETMSIVEKDSKNLYKIREIQKQIASQCLKK